MGKCTQKNYSFSEFVNKNFKKIVELKVIIFVCELLKLIIYLYFSYF